MGHLPDGIDERRSGHDRRDVSGFNDPRFWVAAAMLAIAIFGSILGYLIAQIATIVETQQRLLVTVTEVSRDLNAAQARVTRAENDITTIEKGYVYNLNHRLTYVEAKTGYKAPPPRQEE